MFPQGKAPDSAAFGANNVYIGEFGWPERPVGESERLNMIRYSVEAALEFGAPYILFWELYCDGPRAGASPPYGNDDMRGNGLIRPDGRKSPVWDYFQSLLSPDAG